MTAEQVKAMLPIIIAFSERRPIQFKDLSSDGMFSGGWITVNPDTTEFSLGWGTNPDEWRVL